MKLKLDLHTHILEATGFSRPDDEVVSRIIAAVKKKGLDGIAITDHAEKNYAFWVKDVVERNFDNEIIIIPGQELDRVFQHMVELYLPDGSVFRFVSHPGYPSSRWAENGRLDDVQGLEINNGNWEVEKDKVKQVAEEHGFLLLSNSDAHHLDNVGRYYNEIDLDELSARATRE